MNKPKDIKTIDAYLKADGDIKTRRTNSLSILALSEVATAVITAVRSSIAGIKAGNIGLIETDKLWHEADEKVLKAKSTLAEGSGCWRNFICELSTD